MPQVLALEDDLTPLSADSRVLWLVRHAKSSWTSGAARDHDRPLAPRGERDAGRLGGWLERNGVQPDVICCSTATRARQTLALARRSWEVPESGVAHAPSLYHAAPEAMLALVAQVPDEARQVMLIGHNPGLDDFLMMLCGRALPRTAKGKLLTTANTAGIRIDAGRWEDVGAGDGRLEVLVRPR